MPTAAPVHAPLTTGLLAAVSRSFYLSLRVLPGRVRHPLSLGYLLARAADTIADVPVRPAAERLALLGDFEQALTTGPGAAFLIRAASFADAVDHAGERVLLTRLGECFDSLTESTESDAALIRGVLSPILRGQSLDIRRFETGDDNSREAPGTIALPNAAALDEYTWLVAGCVGDFWTRVCLLHLPRCSKLDAPILTEYGVNFGKGLQLINILRDQPKDMAARRCYLPLDELHAAGINDPAWPAPDWKPWHAVRRKWLDLARERMRSGRLYAKGLKSARLRLAALLPCLIGEATLDLLDATPDSEAPRLAKVPRPAVKRILWRALGMSLWPRAIRT